MSEQATNEIKDQEQEQAPKQNKKKPRKHKNYYWFKFRSDFFYNKHILFLKSLENGDSLIVMLLKLYAISVKTNGYINIEGYFPGDAISEIAIMIEEPREKVESAIDIFTKYKILEKVSEKEYYLTTLKNLIGKESECASYMRTHRKKKAIQEQEQAKQIQCHLNRNYKSLECDKCLKNEACKLPTLEQYEEEQKAKAQAILKAEYEANKNKPVELTKEDKEFWGWDND